MKKLIFLCLFSAYLSNSAYAGLNSVYNFAAVKKLLNGVFPKSTSFAVSYNCGDGKCVPQIGETSQTCPLDCKGAKIRSYNHQALCDKTKYIHEPQSIDEVSKLLKSIYESSDSKVRFVGALHTTNTLICSDGYTISSKNISKLSDVKIIEENGETLVSTPGGIKLGTLGDHLAKNGYSLGFAYPMYRGVTIAGLLATGSHGSSRKHTAVSSQNIREISIIDGTGEKHIITKENNPELFRAAKVNLGMLGFVYNIKIKITPLFNIKMNVKKVENFVTKYKQVKWGGPCDFEILKWYPSINNAVKICGTKTNEKSYFGAESVAFGKDENNYMFPREKWIVKKALSLARQHPFVANYLIKASYKKAEEKTGYSYQKISLKKNKINQEEVEANNIVGPANKMLHNRLTKGIFQSFSASDFSFSFPLSSAKDVLSDVKEFSEKYDYSFPFIGFYMRFTRAEGNNEGAFLSQIEPNSKKGQVYIMAEFFEYKFYNLEKSFLDQINKERNLLLDMLINKHNIRLHWGKSNKELFAKSDIQKVYGDNLEKFSEISRQMDPKGMFSNGFTQFTGLDSAK